MTRGSTPESGQTGSPALLLSDEKHSGFWGTKHPSISPYCDKILEQSKLRDKSFVFAQGLIWYSMPCQKSVPELTAAVGHGSSTLSLLAHIPENQEGTERHRKWGLAIALKARFP